MTFLAEEEAQIVAEEEAQIVDILLHPNIGPFLGRPLKDVGFYSMLNFGHFGDASVVTLLTFQNVNNPNT